MTVRHLAPAEPRGDGRGAGLSDGAHGEAPAAGGPQASARGWGKGGLGGACRLAMVDSCFVLGGLWFNIFFSGWALEVLPLFRRPFGAEAQDHPGLATSRYGARPGSPVAAFGEGASKTASQKGVKPKNG